MRQKYLLRRLHTNINFYIPWLIYGLIQLFLLTNTELLFDQTTKHKSKYYFLTVLAFIIQLLVFHKRRKKKALLAFYILTAFQIINALSIYFTRTIATLSYTESINHIPLDSELKSRKVDVVFADKIISQNDAVKHIVNFSNLTYAEIAEKIRKTIFKTVNPKSKSVRTIIEVENNLGEDTIKLLIIVVSNMRNSHYAEKGFIAFILENISKNISNLKHKDLRVRPILKYYV